MAKRKPGMGRGLDAILSVSSAGADAAADELRELPVELIVANPKQPRRRSPVPPPRSTIAPLT